MTMELGVLVRLGDRLTAPLRGVVSSVTSSSRRMADSLGKTTAGLRKMSDGLGKIAAQTRGVAMGLAAYSGTMAGLALSFVSPAAQMERFRVQLTSLEGSSAGAEKALSWISDFATRTPLEMTDTIDAYAKLKAFGIDPTNGSLQAMVDTMAATGGGVEKLDGLVAALGQAWAKGKLQSEEAIQLLERGVPVWDILAKKMGITTEEVQKLASEGKLGRDAISQLTDGMGERSAGASEEMSKGFDGMVSNIMDHWAGFQRMVMASGVFDSLKSKLQSFLDLLNQMAADGRLQKYADDLATNMLWAIEGIWNFGKGLVETWQAVLPWLEAGASAIGSLGGFLGQFVDGATAAKITALGGAIFGVGKVLLFLARLATGNPILLAISLIAAGAILIYQNWGAISAWFAALWNKISGAVQGAWGKIKSTLDAFTPAPIKAAWSIMTDYFAGLWRAVTAIFQGVVTFVAGIFTGDMTRAASGLSQIWDGFKIYFGAIFDAIAAALNLIWQTAIKPVLDGLASVTGIGAAWEGLKGALTSVMDWLGGKFDWLWQKIGPVIDALRWVKGKGAAALQSLGLSGGDAGGGAMPSLDATGSVAGYAAGGSFGRGPIVVGERGPELRYESRGGFIAHNRALRQMASLSARAAAGQNGAVDTGLLRAGQVGKSVTYAPNFSVTIHAGSGNASDIEAAVGRAIAAQNARVLADTRRDLHD